MDALNPHNIDPRSPHRLHARSPRLVEDSVTLLPTPERVRGWWLKVLTVVTVLSIVASQTLMTLPGWSRLGFLVTVAVLGLLCFGRLLGFWREPIGYWLILPTVYVTYSLARSVPEPGNALPADQIMQTISAFSLGLGSALAFQAGVSFRAIAYSQVISIVVSVLGGIRMSDVRSDDRYSGMVGNANEFGMQLALGACLIWLYPKKAGWVACCFGIFAMLYSVASSGSRQAFLVLPVFVTICVIQFLALVRRHRAFIAFVSVYFVFFVGLVAALFAPLIMERLQEITTIKRLVDYQDSSFHKRKAMIRKGLEMWKAAPIFGQGNDAFMTRGGFETYSHNNYVDLLCNLGVVGVLLFYALHLFILGSSFRIPLPQRLACWLLVIVMLATDTGSVSHGRKHAFLVLMVLACLAIRHKQDESRQLHDIVPT